MAHSHDWMDDWLQAQQNYWAAWSELARRGAQPSQGSAEPAKPPLADGLEQWWRAVSPLAPPAGRELFDKLMEVGKGYFALAERFMASGQSQDGGRAAIDAWLDDMGQMGSAWLQGGGTFHADAQAQGMSPFRDLPLDAWHRLAAKLMPMPGDFPQAFPGAATQAMQDQVKRWLSMPTLGYTRESQAQYQDLAQRQMDYLAATQAYQAVFAKLGAETTQAFQRALQERAGAGKPIASLRELYGQWVETSEAAYADFVMTPAYQALYGRLVNTLMALKQQTARLVDQGLEALHLPTQAELATLQSRQQELRRDNLSLRKEIASIQAQLETLRQAAAPPKAEPPARPRPAQNPRPAKSPRPAKTPATRKPGAAQ